MTSEQPAGEPKKRGALSRWWADVQAEAAAKGGPGNPGGPGVATPVSAGAGNGGRDAAARVRAAASGVDVEGAVFVCTSHEGGRNPTVALFADRVVRTQPKRFTSLSRATQETDVTPIKSVTHVTTEKDGLAYTKVLVHTAGGEVSFRLGHDEARRFRDELVGLVL